MLFFNPRHGLTIPRSRFCRVTGLLAVALLQGVSLPTAAAPFASVLPSSRSVEIGELATAYVTLLNPDEVTAEGCSISPAGGVHAEFSYQTTNPFTNALNGAPNTPIDIPPGKSQSFVISLTPTADFPALPVEFVFSCSTGNAPSAYGINTLVFSGNERTVADIVAVAATASGDGIATMPRDGLFGVASVAIVNLGISADITAHPEDRAGLDGTVLICETNPKDGECLEPPAESTTGRIEQNSTHSYAVFFNSNTSVSLDALRHRVGVWFQDAQGNLRGDTSIAVQGGGPSAFTYFKANVADQVVQNTCFSCHSVDGEVGADVDGEVNSETAPSALQFTGDVIAGYKGDNFEALFEYLQQSPEAGPALIDTITGSNGKHPEVVRRDSALMTSIQGLLDLLPAPKEQ